MFVETLVATACVIGKGGCSEATNAYYTYNKDLQEFTKKITKNVEDYGNHLVKGNEWIVYFATPAYTAMTGQTARFKVYNQTVLGVNPRDKLFLVEWSY